MSYAYHLPQVFPYVADVPSHQAARLAKLLVNSGHAVRPDTGEVTPVPNGSSFACTSEPLDGTTRVYMSEWSFRRLQLGGDLYERLPGVVVAREERE